MKVIQFIHVLSWLAAACSPLMAQGRILPPEFPHEKRPMILELELRQLHVEVSIENQLAITKVEHRFFNPGRAWKEGKFYYALPQGAQIRQFSMIINGKATKAELLDAKKAAKIYEDIVRNMRDPALLEFVGAGLIQARVFPIEAGAEKVITLEYQELLDSEDGLTAYELPLQASKKANRYNTRLSLDLQIRSRSPLKTVWSPSHALDVVQPSPSQARASFESSNRQALRSFELFFSQNDAPLGLDVLTHSNRHGRYFLFNLTPALPANKTATPADLIFILDTSGSMAGEKLQQAKAALQQCLQQLKPDDRFAMIRFATDAESFAPEFRYANKSNKKSAKAFVKGFEALGGTHIEAAFDLATQYQKSDSRPQVTLFLTDGKPTIGERNNDALIAKIKGHQQRIFPVGIGSQINTHLLDRMAEMTRGRRTYVRSDEDLEFKISRLFAKIQAPVFSDLSLTVDGIRIQNTMPQQLPDLYRGSSLLVMGTYTGQGRAKIHLSGKYLGRQESFEFKHSFPASPTDHEFIPHLWAKRRVGYLLDQIRLHGESEELKQEVVHLAKRYGLITPYTSYLILEDQAHPSVASRPGHRQEPLLTLPTEERDRVRRDFQDLKKETGRESVAASQSLQKMGEAETLISSEMLGAKAPKPNGTSQPTAIRLGRAFYLRNGEWVDSETSVNSQTHPIELVFGSQAYFKLLNQTPEIAPILALGQRVLFRHAGKVYRISPS